MKRIELIRHLEKHQCMLSREGGNHSIYVNALNGKVSAVPRHKEIATITARAICKQLDIEVIKIK